MLLRAVPDAVAGVAAAAVFLAAFATGAPGAEAAGALAAVGLMVQQMRDLASVWDRHRAWAAARDKCEALLASPRLPRPRRPGPAPLRDAPQPLRFEGVWADALRGIDGCVEAGRKVAVVGRNGAGKSTLIALAAGLEGPSKGEVTLGDRAPGALGVADRRLVALVSARSPIMARSLRRALAMGAAERPADAEVLAQAEAFGLGEVVERLGGLDGRVSEGGRNLSAGEARRVLLARAALSRPRLLLLDEPDDALDAGALALVEGLVRGTDATTLLVTHDLALARRMDEIWYLEKGRLVERGPPDALLAAGGPAARFLAPRPAA